jgi:copper(I)-binding protein
MKATIIAGALGVAMLASAPALSQPAAPTAAGQTYKVGSLVIAGPWSRATPGGATVAGGYLTITNTGSAPDRLTAATLSAAEAGEVHESTTAGGVVRMRPVEGGVEIRPGATIELRPGGYHIMFLRLKQPLKEGDRLSGTLTFEKAGTVPVEFAVRGLGTQRSAPSSHTH